MKVETLSLLLVPLLGNGMEDFMNLEKEKAYDDLTTITETLEQTRKDYSGLYEILWRYGAIQIALCVFPIVLRKVWGDHSSFGFVALALGILAAVYMLIIYFKIYNKENITSNKYYLSCLGMWGVIAVALPFVEIAVRGIILAVSPERALDLLPRLQEFDMLINILLVCFCFIICGFIVNRKGLIILSIIILFVFITLDMLYYNSGVSGRGPAALIIFYYICITVGYLGLSYILRWSSKDGY